MNFIKKLGAAVLVGGFVFSAIASFDYFHPYNGNTESHVSVMSSAVASTLPVKPVIEKVEGIDPWSIQYDHDDMRNTIRRYEANRSQNHVTLDFPYEKGSWVDLVLVSGNVKEHKGLKRESIKPNQVYFHLTDGQFDCGFDGCVASVKFDDGKIETFSLSRSTGGRNDFLFLDNSARFIKEVKSHQHVTIELPIWRDGRQQFIYQLKSTVHKTYSTN